MESANLAAEGDFVAEGGEDGLGGVVVSGGGEDSYWQARLTDGTTVAEWISRYNNTGTIGLGTGFYGGGAGVGLMATTPTYRESSLRLTFGTNHQAGVCIHFTDKVPSRLSRKGHSALPVTVADSTAVLSCP